MSEQGKNIGEPPGGPNPRLFRWGLMVALAALLFDQITKWWMVEIVMRPPQVIPVTPFFNLVLGWNRGVSFGLFAQQSDYGAWALILIALAIVGVLLVWLYRTENLLPAVGIGLVIGGALGNVIDRVRYGAVVDFLDFHAGGYHWPAFNTADTVIFLGACALVFDSLFTDPEKIKSRARKLTDDKP